MTGSVDDRMRRTCFDHLRLFRTAEERETSGPAVFTKGGAPFTA
jgi:hypothetical protein